MRPVPLALPLAAVLAAQAPAPAPVPPAPVLGSLAGTWEGTDGIGVRAAFKLTAEGYATLHLGGEVLGGPAMRYAVDASRTPAWIDFIALDATGAERGRLLGLVERLGPDEIRLRMGFGGQRPASFEGATPETTITLRRKP